MGSDSHHLHFRFTISQIHFSLKLKKVEVCPGWGNTPTKVHTTVPNLCHATMAHTESCPHKADHELYSWVWVLYPQVFYVSKSIPGLSGFSGTRYLYPWVFRNKVPDTCGFSGTARHSQAQTSVHSSYGKLLVHNIINYAVYQIYSTTYCSKQLHICSRCAYIMSTFLIWHICIINQL